jgi:hypothetical protein
MRALSACGQQAIGRSLRLISLDGVSSKIALGQPAAPRDGLP